jgi:hypothetical protein
MSATDAQCITCVKRRCLIVLHFPHHVPARPPTAYGHRSVAALPFTLTELPGWRHHNAEVIGANGAQGSPKPQFEHEKQSDY